MKFIFEYRITFLSFLDKAVKKSLKAEMSNINDLMF